MIITHAHAKNFQSYETIDFSYNTLGLCLVSGPTGAGKSTLLDLVPWVLYGKTSKDGNSDDIRSWASTSGTLGMVRVQLPDNEIIVDRRRGNKNDLYWCEVTNGRTSPPIRGKDLTETQSLLEARLGVSAELFVTGSYLTQFSKADSFFIASAKERRAVLEQISDQEWAIKLGEKASEARKEAKKIATSLETQLSGVTGKLEALNSSLDSLKLSRAQWEYKQKQKIDKCEENLNNYQSSKIETVNQWRKELQAKIDVEASKIVSADALAEEACQLETSIQELGEGNCSKCGAPSDLNERKYLEKKIQILNYKVEESKGHERILNIYTEQLRTPPVIPQNPFISLLQALKMESNPFYPQIDGTEAKIVAATTEQLLLSQALQKTSDKHDKLNWLYDKSFELRGILMERAVTQIQDKTNYYLEKFFDATIRIKLVVSGSDKIDVEIANNAHLCPFTSMSGGERCMLKLAFSLSLMRAAQDKAGVAFGLLMLDEPLSGLDEGLRVKAYGLLEELAIEYPSVLVVEHSESFKSMFSNVISITKENGISSILVNE